MFLAMFMLVLAGCLTCNVDIFILFTQFMVSTDMLWRIFKMSILKYGRQLVYLQH